ncbi:MAG: hypothetical protein Q4G52_04915 [Clostridia bacterium]|nr:hypothetical protein [Clostridia bacterium]
MKRAKRHPKGETSAEVSFFYAAKGEASAGAQGWELGLDKQPVVQYDDKNGINRCEK